MWEPTLLSELCSAPNRPGGPALARTRLAIVVRRPIVPRNSDLTRDYGEFASIGGIHRFLQVEAPSADNLIMEVMGGTESKSRVDGPGSAAIAEPITYASPIEERMALGEGLRRRERDVLLACQEAYMRSADTPYEEVIASPLWDILSIAVNAIVDWLTQGNVAAEVDKSRIASLGTSVASMQVASSTSDSPAASPQTSVPRPSRGAAQQLSVALLTKLNLWWSEQTCAVLSEEAARLDISRATLDETNAMVVRSCNASLVRMAKQYDAELTTLHQELSHLALHDPLTGLANRKVFLDRLDRALARLARHSGGIAVIFMDLDHFKRVNDLHGHACGDTILVEMARRMAEHGRPEDLFARMSGDEFVALIEDLPHPMEDAQALAERLRLALLAPIEVDGKTVEVTVSIGIAVASDPGLHAEHVLARADSALYSVKRIGRNGVAAIEMGSGAQSIRFTEATGLHNALDNGELHLAYQPILSTHHEVVAFEALLRWDHPERGAIPPAEFIPMAEESGQMVSIGAWVIGEACRQAVQWRDTIGIDVPMSVNISAWQLSEPTFVDVVADTLYRTSMKADNLILEIAEGILTVGDSDHREVFSRLKVLGVRLSVDDFGAGHSALTYLRRLPFDQIKIDRAFILDAIDNGDTRIMESLIRLAHDLGLQVVAEGVETHSEFEAMQSMGCDTFQGFLLGRPVSAATTEHRYREGRFADQSPMPRNPGSEQSLRQATEPIDHVPVV